MESIRRIGLLLTLVVFGLSACGGGSGSEPDSPPAIPDETGNGNPGDGSPDPDTGNEGSGESPEPTPDPDTEPDPGNGGGEGPVATLACDTGAGTVFEVGPGNAYAELREVPWENLTAGDTVRIHWRPTAYRDKVLISNSGTQQQPIRVCGVASDLGQRPVIDGDGAGTRPQIRYAFDGMQERGIVTVSFDDNDDYGDKPQHVLIQGLEIRGATPDRSFVDGSGQARSYRSNAAGIFVERGEDITIRDCLIRDNANGLFVASGDEEATVSRRIRVEANHFVDNSLVGRDGEHHSYVEAEGALYQYNHYDRTRAGSLGGALKDRSAGTVVRYNAFEGGRRFVDLIEADFGFAMLGGLPTYREAFVYGNVMLSESDDDTVLPVHYGGDLGNPDTYRKGTLFFFNNTLVFRINQADRFNASALDVSTNDERVEVWNNLFFVESETPGATPVNLHLTRFAGSFVYGDNLISPGVLESRTDGSYSGQSSGYANVRTLAGNAPGFVDAGSDDFRLAGGSAAVDAGQAAPASLGSRHPLNQQYRPHLGFIPRTMSGMAPDIGAFEADGAPSSPAPAASGDRVPGLDFMPDLGGVSTGMPCGANVLCVSPGGGAAYTSIQSAVNAAPDGATIQVAAGHYSGNVVVRGKAVTLLGGFAADSDFTVREPAAHATIITGAGDDATVTLFEAGASVIDGFVIRGGTGTREFAPFGINGGGVFAYRGSPTIANNVIEGNDVTAMSGSGGGIHVDVADAVIRGNLIRDNRAFAGAAIDTSGGSVSITQNRIEDNHADGDHGGGLYLFGPDITVSRNLIRGNRVGDTLGYGWGGGMIAVNPETRLQTRHNRIIGNSAPSLGSGVFIDEGAQAQMRGDIVHGNSCAGDGSGIYVDGMFQSLGSDLVMVNVTVADHVCNGGNGGQGLFIEGGSSVSLRNSIFWNNGVGDLFVCDAANLGAGLCGGGGNAQLDPSTLDVSYSLIQEGAAGTGNRVGDPGFANPAAGDYHLRPGSIAIDAADPLDAVEDEPAPNGGRRNLGAYGGTAEAATSP